MRDARQRVEDLRRQGAARRHLPGLDIELAARLALQNIAHRYSSLSLQGSQTRLPIHVLQKVLLQHMQARALPSLRSAAGWRSDEARYGSPACRSASPDQSESASSGARYTYE